MAGEEEQQQEADQNEEAPPKNENPEVEEYSEEEDSDSEDDSDDDSSEFDSDMEDEANRLMDALRQENEALRQQVAAAATKTPEEAWDEFIAGVEGCSNATIKVTDEMVSWVASTSEKEKKSELCEKLCQDLVRASQAGFVVIHSILGRQFLSLLSAKQQELIYQAIMNKHAKTITYWKLGSDDSTEPCGIPTTALLEGMASVDWPNLTELEIRGLELETQNHVDLLLAFLKRAPKIRQFNLLGLLLQGDNLQSTMGLFDPIVAQVQTIPGFDELQLCRSAIKDDSTTSTNDTTTSLISTNALEQLLANKVKWWRFSLDGMGLTNQHIAIIAAALAASKDCKMNDLLSLQNNPLVTDGAGGWEGLYKVCLYKQRMGLVLSDHAQWVATFDMVRPLNNLHRRLEYIVEKEDTGSGTASTSSRKYKYKSRDEWMEFLSVVGNLAWVGESRQVNYLWFAMLEQPELIYES